MRHTCQPATTPGPDHRRTAADRARSTTIRDRPTDDAGTVVPIHCGGYSVADIAEILTVPPTTVCAWARAGLIPARKIGRRWVIPRRQFDTWIDELPEATDADFQRERRRLDHAARRRLAPGRRR